MCEVKGMAKLFHDITLQRQTQTPAAKITRLTLCGLTKIIKKRELNKSVDRGLTVSSTLHKNSKAL